jgi:beta-N-acetylhexosaminidase
LIGADFESGSGMRIDEGTSFPSAMASGRHERSQACLYGGKIHRDSKRAPPASSGYFAPDADVNNNPDNPIINIRSFGEDPARCGISSKQFVRGVEENGALATAKHFPGHGDVSVDSHLALATVPGRPRGTRKHRTRSLSRGHRAGVSSIMPGHLSCARASSRTRRLPRRSRTSILTGLLRDEMKFRGLIVTDAMDMGGVTSLYAPGEAAVRSVEAGADVLLMPPVPDAAMAGLEEAVTVRAHRRKRIDESVRRDSC